jgi:hypothetical protein
MLVEYVSNLGGRFVLHLVHPKISSPFKCDILTKNPKLEEYLATSKAIWIRSLD